ncbi:uncharacterized protein LOC101742870 [Bombyx mori]|uniref:uncharacterized protein LOC101742870 n=1 Tax=Bombyx mori TaxID=7091 RepID=UPI000B3C4429
MDFLDSLDLDTDNKSQRVRSWYLYEQFKEIEKNQLDAARRLKDKSYQDKILRHGLAERKARRRLHDQFGACESDSRLHYSSKYGDETILSISAEDIFESLADFHDETPDGFDDFHDDLSRVDSVVGNSYKEDFKSLEDFKDCNSCTETISVRDFKNVESADNLRNEANEMEPFLANNFDIKSQIEYSQKDFKEIENLMTPINSEEVSEVSSLVSVKVEDGCDEKPKHSSYEIVDFALWSKLVSFAYQIIKLNHGNCFYDYSSQFLTAVLICDALKKGISKMCHILQPYVSPIKFADENNVNETSQKHKNREKLENLKKSMTFLKFSPYSSDKHCQQYKRDYGSEKYARGCHGGHLGNYYKNVKSEPWRTFHKFSVSKNLLNKASRSSFIRSDYSRKSSSCNCEICDCCHKKISNPMLKIARRIDDFIKLDSPRHI